MLGHGSVVTHKSHISHTCHNRMNMGEAYLTALRSQVYLASTKRNHVTKYEFKRSLHSIHMGGDGQSLPNIEIVPVCIHAGFSPISVTQKTTLVFWLPQILRNLG